MLEKIAKSVTRWLLRNNPGIGEDLRELPALRRLMTTILFVKRRMASLLLWVRTPTQLTDCASGKKHYLVRVRS